MEDHKQLYDDNNATDFNNTLSNLDVSSASSLVVGFTFNINGGSDGFRSMNVNVVETPCLHGQEAQAVIGFSRD